MTSHALDLATPGTAPDTRFAVVPWGDFAALDGWRALARRAADPNPFAEEWCLVPALESFDRAGQVRLAVFERAGQVAGILPLARHALYDRYPLPHLANWLHANMFCGSPLVEAGAEEDFWSHLLGWADASARAALFLHLQALPTDGALFRALQAVGLRERRAAAVVHRAERAMLDSDLSPEAYFTASLSGKKRKELRRQFNRLSDEGTVAFHRQADAEDLDKWIAGFLALERAGWKGAQGSALACRADTREFFARALRGAAAHGRLERLTLSLDGRPVAMLANLVCPPGAYSFKTTYDERLARFSPGVLLQRENLALLARDAIEWTDSCAAPDHPMIDHIWRERRAMVRVSLAIGGPVRRGLARRVLRVETGAEPEGL